MDDLEYILESVFGEVLDIEDLAPGVCQRILSCGPDKHNYFI